MVVTRKSGMLLTRAQMNVLHALDPIMERTTARVNFLVQRVTGDRRGRTYYNTLRTLQTRGFVTGRRRRGNWLWRLGPMSDQLKELGRL